MATLEGRTSKEGGEHIQGPVELTWKSVSKDEEGIHLGLQSL